MQTVEIPFNDWRRTLDRFSAVHEGWLVSVDVLSAEMGAQPEVRELPLRGITAEPDGLSGAIAITAGRTGEGHLTHRVTSPAHVWIERTDDGADAALEIASTDGTKTILRFRVAARPETVDGVVRH